jgi:hypothetical protein
MSYAAEIRIRFGLETSVAYTSGEFRGNDVWLRVSVEVVMISHFINDIRFRRRVPDLIRHICNLCLYRVHERAFQSRFFLSLSVFVV